MTHYCVDSMSGNDGFPGNSELWPWRTIEPVNSGHFWPGDDILFRCGGEYGRLIVASGGIRGTPIRIGSYGRGPQPVFVPDADALDTIFCEKEYVCFENVYTTVANVKGAVGIRLSKTALGNEIHRVLVAGIGSEYETTGIRTRAPDTIIMNNDLCKTTIGILAIASVPSSVLIFKNLIHELTGKYIGSYGSGDGIVINGVNEPDCSRAIVGFNDISGFQEDGIDIWQCTGLTVEHNYIHEPIPNTRGSVSGIRSKGVKSGANIIHYNHIVNMVSPHTHGFGITPRVGHYSIRGNYIRTVTSRCISLYQGADAEIYENALLDSEYGIFCSTGATMREHDNIFRVVVPIKV